MIFVKINANTNESENKMTRYQDDFYCYLNGEWQQTAEITADVSQTGGFVDLAGNIEDLIGDTTDKWLAGYEVPEDAIGKLCQIPPPSS